MILQSTFRQTVVVTSVRINLLWLATRKSKTKVLASIVTAKKTNGGLTENRFLREWIGTNILQFKKKKIIHHVTEPTPSSGIEKQYTEQSGWDEGKNTWRQAKSLRQALNWFEPPISCLQDRRITHYATEPHMSFENDKKFIITNWQINKHQHTSQHVRFRERKKFKVHIDQSPDVYIIAPVRKTVALTPMIHTMQHFTTNEHLPLCSRAW